jgi:hypothetical protein
MQLSLRTIPIWAISLSRQNMQPNSKTLSISESKYLAANNNNNNNNYPFKKTERTK